MTRRPPPPDVELAAYRRARGTEGLPMFSAPVVELPGAGQVSRREARQRQTRKRIEETYALIAKVLTAAGPNGLTRKELAEWSGLNVNTVNARCAEMRARTDALRVVTEGRRNGESILHLRPPRADGRDGDGGRRQADHRTYRRVRAIQLTPVPQLRNVEQRVARYGSRWRGRDRADRHGI